jgi:hypothetical protein
MDYHQALNLGLDNGSFFYLVELVKTTNLYGLDRRQVLALVAALRGR